MPKRQQRLASQEQREPSFIDMVLDFFDPPSVPVVIVPEEQIERPGPQVVYFTFCHDDDKSREERDKINDERFQRFLDIADRAYGYTVVLDEAHLFWDDWGKQISNLIRTVRHREQDWWFVTHRFAYTPGAVLSQLDEAYLFKTILPADLERIKRGYGVEPDALKGLGVGEYVKLEF